jgi:ABC-type bacteriocin/lantibiotic exporter with double-glycine peptidase domain
MIKKVLDLLDARDRRQALLLLLMILAMALLETTSVASVMPFVGVLTHPGLVESNQYLSAAYHWLEFQSVDQFILFLGFVMLVVTVGSTAFKALTSWATLRFTNMRQYSLSRRLCKIYLARPYDWFLDRHSADLSKSVLFEIAQVVSGALLQGMQLIAQATLAILVIVLLISVNAQLAITITIILGGIYGFIVLISRRYVKRIGEERVRANHERFKIFTEAFGGIKEVKMLGLEEFFLNRFAEPARQLADRTTAGQMLSQLPQYAIQATAVSAVLVIILYKLALYGSNYGAVPLLALYAVAGYRLLPALQRVYQSISSIRFTQAALESIHRDWIQGVTDATVRDQKDPTSDEPIHLRQRLDLQNASYRYPSGTALALRDITMSIPVGAMVGFVGRTGSGKTTAVDLMLGLLEPTTGQLLVDGTPITSANKRTWQRSVGYVPQHIFIADDTVASNIALGVAANKIDEGVVEQVARIANLHDFVAEELKDGYRTTLGEHGLRLSGGQRQRVGIARALYRDPDLLIMDEATSALDNITERLVIDAVADLHGHKTVILVAHRLTTVRRCDIIFVFDQGRIVASGTYDELLDGNVHFRAMANSVERVE